MHQNWKFHHVATIVRDINQAIEHYRTLEIGAFPPFIELGGITPLVEKATYGQPSDYSIDMRHAEGSVGDLCFELIELLTGDTPARDFLEKKRGGYSPHRPWTTSARKPLSWPRKASRLPRAE